MEDYFSGKVVYHKVFGTGRTVNVEENRITVNFVKSGIKQFDRDAAAGELSDTSLEEEGDDMEVDELKEAIREVLMEEGLAGHIKIADKWEGGELILKPGNPELQLKSVPVETFFHKIVMIRNQLRMLEQNINSSQSLNDREKVDLQQYITRCYGSLTTFNVLFADKKDWFVGSKKE